jgi:hypothetical protein
VAGAVAERLRVDPAVDPRPGLLAGAAVTVMDSVLNAWITTHADVDLVELVEARFRLLEEVVASERPSVPEGSGA